MEQIQIHQLSIEEFRGLLAEIIQEHLDHANTESTDQLLTRNEVAKRLDISLPTLHKYSELGILISRKIGGRVYFLWSEVLEAAIKVEPSHPINNYK